MVSRFRVSAAQAKALGKLARQKGPVQAREIHTHSHVLEGLYRRGFVTKTVDPGGRVSFRWDVWWGITPKGRDFLETRVYYLDYDEYEERQKETTFGQRRKR